MAGSSNLGKFYALIAVIAVVGAGAIWMQRDSGSGDGYELTPIDLGGFQGYTLGSPDAPVEIIEYADFQCPACSRHAVLTGPDLISRFVANGTVRISFRDFPLDMHSNAMPAHMAAACADEQGSFWEMHDSLFYNQNDWSVSRRPERMFRDYADAMGLDVGRFRECVSSGRYLARLQASAQQAQAQGVGSTPSFIINGRLYPGALPFDDFRRIIDAAIAEGAEGSD